MRILKKKLLFELNKKNRDTEIIFNKYLKLIQCQDMLDSV